MEGRGSEPGRWGRGMQCRPQPGSGAGERPPPPLPVPAPLPLLPSRCLPVGGGGAGGGAPHPPVPPRPAPPRSRISGAAPTSGAEQGSAGPVPAAGPPRAAPRRPGTAPTTAAPLLRPPPLTRNRKRPPLPSASSSTSGEEPGERGRHRACAAPRHEAERGAAILRPGGSCLGDRGRVAARRSWLGGPSPVLPPEGRRGSFLPLPALGKSFPAP